MAPGIVRRFVSAYLLEVESKENVYREVPYRINAFDMPDESFIQMFRVNKSIAMDICEKLSPVLDSRSHRETFDTKIKVLCALRFFATGSYQQSVANDVFVCMSQASASRCIRQVSAQMCTHFLKEWLKFPSTPEDLMKIRKEFYELSLFPGVLGAIDGTHIALYGINQQKYNPQDFLNRKGFHSINAQIVCDASLRITNLSARYPGATHDSYIWRNSKLHAAFESNILPSGGSSWLIGDSGYPLEPWLMTPVQNANVGSPEAAYNRAHILARNCVERCNGVLKGRFRCLHKERVLYYDPDVASTIISACAILHNMCIEHNLDFDDDLEDDDDSEEDDDSSAVNANALNIRQRLITLRFT